MDVLVTGGTGQVGTELQALPWPEGVTLHAPGRDALDLADPASVERVARSRRWDAIVSSGAYTAVDQAERDVGTAWLVNAVAPAILARVAAEAGIPIVQVSTDYVFDGTGAGFYAEDAPVRPINVYGASKEGGEQAVRTANPNHAILRTAWVVSPYGKNFVKTMLRLAADRDALTVVGDQQGCPTFAADLAAAIRDVTLALLRGEGAPGTYHFVNAGEASWAEFAAAIFAGSAARGGPSATVRAITTAEYPTPARRPANSRLATGRIMDAFGIAPRPWPVALGETLDRLVSAPGGRTSTSSS